MARKLIERSNSEEDEGSGAYWETAAGGTHMLALSCELDGHRIALDPIRSPEASACHCLDPRR